MKIHRVKIRRSVCVPVVLLLIAAAIADGSSILHARKTIRAEFLRLHVVAASDSPEDQRLKLEVRDAVLSAGAALFDGSVTADQAEERILPRTAALEYAAEKTLRENGKNDSVRIEVKKEYFPERRYGEITLPPGVYRAVKVTIGAGEGRNWWCVMFPPMCLPESENSAEAYFSEAERTVLTQPEKYRIRFKTAEICERIMEKLRRTFCGDTEENETIR